MQGLKGEGQPLPDRPGDAFVSAGDAVGFRVMAEAGVLPEEITLKKQAAAQRAHLATLTDEAERKSGDGKTRATRNAPSHRRRSPPHISAVGRVVPHPRRGVSQRVPKHLSPARSPHLPRRHTPQIIKNPLTVTVQRIG